MNKLREILHEKRKSLGYTQPEMAQALEITLRRYQQLEAGDAEPKGTVLKKYQTKLKGLGTSRNVSREKQDKPIPYYDIDVSAGNVTLFDDNKEVPSGYLSFYPFDDCDFATNVRGDSMYPKYKNGEVIVCKEIHDWKSFVQYGEVYLVVTYSKQGDSQRFVKFVRKSETKGYYKMCSENPKHDAFDVPLDDIRRMFIVKGTVDVKTM